DVVHFSRPPTPGAQPLHIGWYDFGAMGYFMARNIATSCKSQATPPVLVVRYQRQRISFKRLENPAKTISTFA
ncbi:hypothetical protein PAXRUDRAFT_131878, partial [Paxillus rubicundulus Ve08.2h10]